MSRARRVRVVGARHVVFYRNMNLGHRGSPDRATLETVLSAAGGRGVTSFQTNGTVLFEADDPLGVVRGAAAGLETAAGYAGTAMVRSLESLVEVLGAEPFRGYVDERTYRTTFTFFDGGKSPETTLPWTNARGDVDVVDLREGLVLAVVRKAGATVGNPTAEVERLTGAPATTRTSGTVERLVRAAARG